MCPHCNRATYGSASRGNLGKYYPAYHCNKRGHYFRVSKKDFDETIKKFVQNIKLAPGFSDALVKAVLNEWDKRESMAYGTKQSLDKRIMELKAEETQYR